LFANLEESGKTMNTINNFAKELGSKILLDSENLLNKKGRFFLLNKKIRLISQKDFFYSGVYLGKVEKGKFSPSLNLLSIVSKNKANKVVIDKRAAWLFICGRDIFRKSILGVEGSTKKGNRTLILNNFGDSLGFGKIILDLDRKSKKNEVVIKNILDIGDFLRREK
jgi:ribosome biogenesis protein Nip4